ncbi:SDR family NAD(P)-dependent oxidoreductase [Nocardioides sp. CBS4Y-1]|uniref:SDR family NAD(P)-dependent oxidoreductase n=1 Tax=Nocardioides acrostichi TaxID=2784339 RepID=A0A930UVW6_9ACTN|nr:SDR family NAD(P)-dependent oxidoreductase [Nocardioides acrostichi]
MLVTGAASGLGAALAAAFEARGDRVLRTDVAVPHDIAPDDDGWLPLDITSESAWTTARAHVEQTWGGLDVLVNNAGVAGGGRLDVAGLDEWRWIFEINLFGMVAGLRTFVPVFKHQRGGQIVNVASLAGLVHPGGMASYNAVKSAVVALTETAGHELAGYGITAHVVCPGFFRTNLMNSIRGADSALAGVMEHLVTGSPIAADDVAGAVLAGLEAGEELIVPDEPAQQAVALKRDDRAAYDAVMRAQAARLDSLG